ncbi:MAG: transcriptional regulator [Planctomycetales bacterium]|nr:transcriptional regulator [Planctomycetales bacterium]
MAARRKPDTSNPGTNPGGNGRFSYQGLDRVMHEKARLGILASLAANDAGLLFNDLKQLCSLTDGNLSRHLAVLVDAGLVEIWKGVGGPRPQTMYRLTAVGRKRFAEYINELERVIADAQLDARRSADHSTGRGGNSTGWSTS